MSKKTKVEFVEEELVCLICGFITHSYKDLVEHLSQQQIYEEECCNIKVCHINYRNHEVSE